MINLCKKDVLSYCDKPKSLNDQKTCRYFQKATYYDRCFYLTFDYFCGSIEAQRDRDGKLSDVEIAEIEESKLE